LVPIFDPFKWSSTLWKEEFTVPPTDGGTGNGNGNAVMVVPKQELHVVYIDRQHNTLGTSEQQSRHIAPESNTALLALLTQLAEDDPLIRVSVVRFEDHPFVNQTRIARSADVLIGVHGAGLTHAFEMHPHRWCVEIFTSSKPFIFTYSIVSKLMSHTHLVINDGKPFVPSWEATGNWARNGSFPAKSKTDIISSQGFKAIESVIREARSIVVAECDHAPYR
jgi:hypothetical protein